MRLTIKKWLWHLIIQEVTWGIQNYKVIINISTSPYTVCKIHWPQQYFNAKSHVHISTRSFLHNVFLLIATDNQGTYKQISFFLIIEKRLTKKKIAPCFCGEGGKFSLSGPTTKGAVLSPFFFLSELTCKPESWVQHNLIWFSVHWEYSYCNKGLLGIMTVSYIIWENLSDLILSCSYLLSMLLSYESYFIWQTMQSFFFQNIIYRSLLFHVNSSCPDTTMFYFAPEFILANPNGLNLTKVILLQALTISSPATWPELTINQKVRNVRSHIPSPSTYDK